LTVLDPGSRPGFGYDSLVEHVASRIELVPRFTWKLKQMPLGLDRPYWVENPDFEVRKHIQRVGVPSPGGLRELTELAGHLHAQPLDRSRSLWEMWLIEGLEGGRCALYIKLHHCLMDGASGAGLGEVLADFTPDAEGPVLVPDSFDEETPREPTRLELLRNGLRNDRDRRRKLVGHLRLGLGELIRGARRARDESEPTQVPRTFFNAPVGRRRGLASASLPLEPVKGLKKHFNVTLNDVVLAIVSSAMRRYLRERGELPEQPLVAMCPISTRSAEDTKLENQITQMNVPIATHLDDPIDRLTEINEATIEAKRQVEEGHFDIMKAIGETLSPALVGLVVKGADLAGDAGPLPGNFVVSNVRGTPMPLYLGGARVESLMPMSLLCSGQGLNVTVVSYCDKIDIGLTVDPELVPDAWRLAEHFPAALEELESAAEGVVHRAR
jgi:WS/DGAT/MGAT family acyltransferase